MKIFALENDLKIVYVKASSFPEGIMAAHEKIRSFVSDSSQRNYFGISAPDQTGTIQYKAGTTELLLGELEKLNLEGLLLKKGNYISTTIYDYHNHLQDIEKTFQQMIHRTDIDPQGCCVEWYLNEKDVRCMIRLHSNE